MAKDARKASLVPAAVCSCIGSNWTDVDHGALDARTGVGRSGQNRTRSPAPTTWTESFGFKLPGSNALA
jgi:hypothetical protein